MTFLDTARLTFVLTVPPETPSGEFWLRSNVLNWHPAPDGWKFEGGRLAVDVPLGTLLEVKVTRGTPDTEEGDEYGHRSAPTRLVVSGNETIELSVRGWQDLERPGKPSTKTGRVDAFTLASPELGLDRDVLVWHPDKPGRFPVLYMHDGHNCFDEATAFNGDEWRVDEAAAGRDVIVVAVSVGAERNAIYTPFKARVNGYEPRAREYISFLADTLKPHVDATYATLADRAHTGLAGSSFGGLVSLYGGLTRPEIFGFVGAFSPSLWVGDFELFDFVARSRVPDTRVYVDTGDHEGESVEGSASIVRGTRELADLLAARTKETRLEIGRGHWHDETAWAARFPDVLRWFLE